MTLMKARVEGGLNSDQVTETNKIITRISVRCEKLLFIICIIILIRPSKQEQEDE